MKEISSINRTKGEARNYYNRISKYYDIISGKKENKINKLGLKRLGTEPEDEILEIGFGTGKILKEIITQPDYRGTLFGIDISDGMIIEAGKRFNNEEKKRIKLICGDAVVLPFGNEEFDKIFISFTLELFDTPEIPVVLKECKRVLKSSGKICVVSMSKRKESIMEKIYEWSHRHFPKLIDCRPLYTKEVLVESRFKVEELIEESLYGLPVDIIICKK